MRQLQRNRLKSSRTETQSENRSQTTRQPRDRHTSEEVALAAEPAYDRAYDQLLTLEEAVRR
ncbi:hypothetical protein CP557_21810 [Natrinema ejinorense]|uniref:Uncharacterized protein n=1 Tax=Natrinema ejinorense TaxID=373386 RepID=A0A2A5QP88_9EURY|nr:hypothetical protein CP557_21810 [Natrinema ejinorense]